MKKFTFLLASFILVALAMSSCKDEDNPSVTPTAKINSCEGCHTDYDALKRLAKIDTGAVGGGCSGEVTHIDPWDRVYINPTGFKVFKTTKHYSLGCTNCHNGVDNTEDKAVAHSNNFIHYPSKFAEQKCKTCHADEVTRSHNSIHEQGWGQKRKVTVRYGLAGAHEFDKLPENIKKGYDDNCATCHGTCGDCHVNKPKAVGGGLMNGHVFGKPDMVETCVACHKTRVGHAYLGMGIGSQADVHLTKNGFKCMDCHTKNEMHGDGNTYETRFNVPNMPKCEDCHKTVASSNTYHSMHANNLSCFTCHSQPYNNCGSCHIGGDGARIAAYADFKIGANPIPNTRKHTFAPVRRTLMAPDSWSKYGLSLLANFDAFPTYNYTTPHNILKRTAQTSPAAGKACYDACHIIKEGDNYRNKELYLFESNLLPWEVNANKKVVVNGKLPSSWGVTK